MRSGGPAPTVVVDEEAQHGDAQFPREMPTQARHLSLVLALGGLRVDADPAAGRGADIGRGPLEDRLESGRDPGGVGCLELYVGEGRAHARSIRQAAVMP